MATNGGVAGGRRSVVVGKNVYGNIYHVYQASPGRKALTEKGFQQVLHDYLSWVQNAYRKARLYGLESLPTAQGRPVRDLSQVFVPLTLRQFQPLRREEVELLAEEKLDNRARAYLRLVEARQKDSDLVPLHKLLILKDKIAIVGGAGSGKSTLLAHFAFTLATAALAGAALPVELPRGKPSLVPLLIPLRYFREYVRLCESSPQKRLSNPRVGTLAGFISWYLKGRSPALEISEDFFDRLLLGGGCLLMLDGLDEVVSREARGRVRQQVEDIVNDVYPGNHVLVTPREAGYREDAVFGDDFVRLDVQLLNDDQIQALVTNWCGQLYPGEAERRTAELMSAIRDINDLRTDRDLPPLVSTPLMTTMVVSVKWGETELPRERAKLYEACVKVILQAQYIPDDPVRKELVEWGGAWEEQRDWLAVLALAMHEEGRAGAAVPEARVREVLCQELPPESLAQFLEAVRYRGGLLEERAELFQFVHLTFQEFLAARWLAKERQGAWLHLRTHLTDAWWREVFLLTYGFAQADHPRFAREYLEWLSTQKGDGESQLAGLELAGAALLELERPHPEVRRRQAERLKEALINPALTAAAIQRARAGDTLARLGDPRFRADAWFLPAESLLGFVKISAGSFRMGSDKKSDPQADDDELPQHPVTLPCYYISRYPVTVAQFRAFIEESGHRPEDENCLYGLPNHPVVYVTWYEARKFCDWITERLREWEETPEPLATLLRQEGWQVTLPSEAEWEKAACGENGWVYPWGNEFDPDKANTDETGIGGTSAVGCFPAGASQPYGLMDLSGNVLEWTRSVYADYPYPNDLNERR
ncbi:MAG: SUMF1/EgtB/PvdO family nonheme iron enzyme, partial [Deltaproteobacteria bacterium]|nr:SUMF1/EgtB/PvdO family nonheme iron enzyme [Deltaproteobacteria bacterium]